MAAFTLAPEPLPAVWPKWRAPDGVIGLVGTWCRIVGQRDRGVVTLAPHDVIGRVDDAVVVVVAGQTRSNDAEHAGRVKLSRVPSESAGKSRQLDRREGAAESAPVEDVERIARLRLKQAEDGADQAHRERAAQRQLAGHVDVIELAARRRAAQLDDQRIGVAEHDIPFEADFGRAGAGGQAAVEVGRAGAEEIAGPAHRAVEIDRADHRDRVVVDHRRVDGRVVHRQGAVVDDASRAQRSTVEVEGAVDDQAAGVQRAAVEGQAAADGNGGRVGDVQGTVGVDGEVRAQRWCGPGSGRPHR